MTHAEFVRDIRALALPRGFSSDGVVMVLGLYFDKSGPTDEIPAVTVAGVISTAEKWDRFTEEWEHALHDFEVPFFHMVDYESGYGPYKEWQDRGVKQERLGRLLDIIERNVLATVGSSVAVADCASWSPEVPLESAYRLAASHCFNVIPQYRYLQKRPTAQVLYTFEAGDQGHGKLQAVYDGMYNEPWRRVFNRLGGELEVERKQCPPLQAADILAFEGWKHWAREYGGETRPTRYPWARLSKSVLSEWATLRPMKPTEVWTAGAERIGASLPLSPTYAALLDAVVGEIPTAPLSLPSWG